MHPFFKLAEQQSWRTRRIVLAVGATLAPVLALTALAALQIRQTANSIQVTDLGNVQQYARLAARELTYQLMQSEGALLQALDLESQPALAESLAAAEGTFPGVACFALMADDSFLYPSEGQFTAESAMTALPATDSLRSLRVAARHAREFQSRLGTGDVARAYLPVAGGDAVTVSLFRLQAGAARGMIGACWSLRRVREWCKAMSDQILPGSYHFELKDYDGRVLFRTPETSSAPGAGQSQPLSVSLPMAKCGLPWIVSIHSESTSRAGLFMRRQVLIHAGILGLLLLFTMAGIWLLVAVTTREAELGRVKSSFAAGVSHELRTPLALIRAAGEALSMRQDMDDARRAHYLDIIQRESLRLTDLIDTVLTFTRLEQRSQVFHPESNDVCGLVREFASDYRAHVEEQGFEFNAAIPEEPMLAKVDAEALRLILVNLLDNAVKFSRECKVVCLSVARNAGRISICMEDRGIGIPPEDHTRIFDSFFRGNSDLVRRTRGTGIGLALVRRIVEAHGGSMNVSSTPGKGSRFEVLLPGLEEKV